MKYLTALLLTLSFSAHGQFGQVCGLYQVEDFGDRVLYTIIRFGNAQTKSNAQTVFTITNPGHQPVRGMVRGMCYCVSGIVRPDPEFEGDENYQLLTLGQVENAGYTGCMPGDTPSDYAAAGRL